MSPANTDTMMTKQANSDLTRSEAALIRSHWTTVRRALPHPQSIWRWGETDLPHRVLHRWKWAGLIECVDDRDRLWRTSMRLWCHVITRAGDEEVVGSDACGQELLPTDLNPRGMDRVQTRVLADTTADRTHCQPDRQATLGGESVPVSDVQSRFQENKLRTNKEKGERNFGKAERVARDPSQTRLNTIELHDLSNWDVQVPWFRANSVGVPVGDVY